MIARRVVVGLIIGTLKHVGLAPGSRRRYAFGAGDSRSCDALINTVRPLAPVTGRESTCYLTVHREILCRGGLVD